MSKSYGPGERLVLKYAVSLAEIVAGHPETKWTIDEFCALPGTGIELVDGMIQPKHWNPEVIFSEKIMT